MSSNCHYVDLTFVKLGEVVRKYENVLDFPPFYLYYLFMKLFLLQSKMENLKNNTLNEKNPWKKNLWTFHTIIAFFWNFYGQLELAKVRNVHAKVTVFCGQFYLKP